MFPCHVRTRHSQNAIVLVGEVRLSQIPRLCISKNNERMVGGSTEPISEVKHACQFLCVRQIFRCARGSANQISKAISVLESTLILLSRWQRRSEIVFA